MDGDEKGRTEFGSFFHGGLTRREFLKVTGSAAVVAACGRPLFAGATYPYGTLGEVISACGWNSSADGAFYFAHVTDIHTNDRGPLKMENKYAVPNFVTDVNRLDPAPAFMTITGDLVSDTFRSKSSWPRAKEGFLKTRRILDDLRDSIGLHLIMGNNGCSWEMFEEVWPERPLYWSFDRGGIHFVGLMGYYLWKPPHGNHAGTVLDDEQLAWLKKDLAGRERQTLVIFTHEPWVDLSAHILHSQVEPLLADWTGDVWNVAGHIHRNKCHLRPLPKTTMRIVETTTPIGAWRPAKGAYRLLFASGGKITAMALRWLTCHGKPLGYELEKPQDTWKRYRPPFEAAKDRLLWGVMVGAGDAPLRGEFAGLQDRISNLRLRKDGFATYRVPLNKCRTEPKYLALLGVSEARVMVSGDGASWREPPEARVKKGRMGGYPALLVALGPDRAGADALHVRVALTKGQIAAKGAVYLYGLALLR